jgi:hypothetical protein
MQINMKNKLSFTGTVMEKYVQQRGTYKTLILVLCEDPDGQYADSKQVPFEFSQKFSNIYEGLKLGDIVTVDFSLAGRKWQDRHFASNRAYFAQIQDPASTASPADKGHVEPQQSREGLPF